MEAVTTPYPWGFWYLQQLPSDPTPPLLPGAVLNEGDTRQRVSTPRALHGLEWGNLPAVRAQGNGSIPASSSKHSSSKRSSSFSSAGMVRNCMDRAIGTHRSIRGGNWELTGGRGRCSYCRKLGQDPSAQREASPQASPTPTRESSIPLLSCRGAFPFPSIISQDKPGSSHIPRSPNGKHQLYPSLHPSLSFLHPRGCASQVS